MGSILKDLLDAYQNRENHRSHLQLIVITHDKRLVENLFTTCRPEYVYALSKDENGTSQIKSHRNFAGEEDNSLPTQDVLNSSMY